MGLLKMWREARGRVLKAEYEDAIARMRNATPQARSAFMHNLVTCHEELEPYRGCSASELKKILKFSKQSAIVMWQRGDWPSALGLAIAAIYLEAESVPGADAAEVKEATALLIKEAERFLSSPSDEGSAASPSM